MKYVLIAIAMVFSYLSLNAQNKVVSDTLFLQSGDTLVGKIESADSRYVYFKQNNGNDLRVNRAVISAEKNGVLNLEFKEAAIDYSNSFKKSSTFFVVGNLFVGTGIALLTVGLLKPKVRYENIDVPGAPGFQATSFTYPVYETNKTMIYSGMGVAVLGAVLNIAGGLNLMSGSKGLSNKSASVIEYDIYGTSASVRLKF